MNELKSCPFCGGQATMHKDTWPGNDGTYRTFWVRCRNRKCGGSTEEDNSESTAAARWNRRAGEDGTKT